jgi:hypothetical protein
MAGDHLLSHDGRWIVIEAVEADLPPCTLFNMSVSEYHTYFVGCAEWKFSVWSHNACGLEDVRSTVKEVSPEVRLDEATALRVSEAVNAGDVLEAVSILRENVAGIGPKRARAIVDQLSASQTYELEYVHNIKEGKVTDKVELEQQIRDQVDALNKILAEVGIKGLKQRISEYSPELEQLGRAIVKSLPSAGVDSLGRELAWLHVPDQILGAEPFAILKAGVKRNNSIVGANNKRLAGEILTLPDTITNFKFKVTYRYP